jgi:hypothetical protein
MKASKKKAPGAKFQELIQAFKKAETDFKSFNEDCLEFGLEILKSIGKYYGLSKNKIYLFSENESGELVVTKKDLKQVMMLRDDAWWQFAFGFCLSDKAEQENETVILEVLIRRDNARQFSARLNGQEEVFVIDRNATDGYKEFLDYLHDKIVSSYLTGLENFIDQQKHIKNIGFQYGKKSK